jgi:diaminopimelate decarboxylase
MLNLNTDKIIELKEAYDDAFYLLDSDQFRDNYQELKKAFSDIYPNFNIAYSYKTNYIPKLCRIVNELGGYAEVVSDMEMEIALRIGVQPKNIIWNGPIKNESKVEQLLITGGTVNIDSVDELRTIEIISRKYSNHTLNVGIRCNYDVGDGVISRFGFDTSSHEFEQALEFVKETSNINLINLQCHFAKRSVEYWPARTEKMIQVLDHVIDVVGYVPVRIDLGGGIFGKMDEALKKQFSMPIPEYTEYAKSAATVFAKRFTDAKIELLIEPGSALAGNCMKFVGKVETIKTIRGKTFATILGSQKNISMSGVNPPIAVYPVGTERKEYSKVDIVGYTCIESDILFKDYSGKLAVGDFIAFSNCGSYSVVMKPPFIMPNFPILDICGEKVEVIKRGECFDDLFHTFNF